MRVVESEAGPVGADACTVESETEPVGADACTGTATLELSLISVKQPFELHLLFDTSEATGLVLLYCATFGQQFKGFPINTFLYEDNINCMGKAVSRSTEYSHWENACVVAARNAQPPTSTASDQERKTLQEKIALIQSDDEVDVAVNSAATNDAFDDSEVLCERSIEVSIATMRKSDRSKVDEVYVCGFVPSYLLPNKCPVSLDPFLEPLVTEVLDLFINGIEVDYAAEVAGIPSGKALIRCMLLLWTGDYPAQSEVGIQGPTSTHYYYVDYRYLDMDLISKQVIEERLEAVPWTSELRNGRIPTNITKRLGFWKAEEFQKFCYPASEYILGGILPDHEYHVWVLIVRITEMVYNLHAKSLSQAEYVAQQFPEAPDVLVGGQHYVLLSAWEREVYSHAADSSGDPMYHSYSDNPYVEPTSTVKVLRSTAILRKVMLYPDPDMLYNPSKYIVIDYLRPIIPLDKNDVIVPHYPEEGDMISVKGIGSDVYLAHIQSVDRIQKTCQVYFYERDTANISERKYKRMIQNKYGLFLDMQSNVNT
eukprot:Em0004g1128a